MEFDAGHGYEDTLQVPDEHKPALWVFGVLDEFKGIGLVEIAGDSPMPDQKNRLLYRRLRDSGYKPGIAEVSQILRTYMIELATPEFLHLFQTVIHGGMAAVKEEVARQKADEVRDDKALKYRGFGDGWIPL